MLADRPLRGWNTGFAGESIPVPDDVAFIEDAVRLVENLLKKELRELGINRSPIDPNRRFVFGYSMGGMMAYKLAHELPNRFAALWVMSGAIGGRAHEGTTRTVTNGPQGTRKHLVISRTTAIWIRLCRRAPGSIPRAPRSTR